MLRTIIVSLFLAITACKTTPKPEPVIVPDPVVIENTALQWETNHPERKAWSARVYALVDELKPKLEKASDLARFCGTSAFDRVLWAQIIDALAYSESRYNPDVIFHEPAPLNQDSVGLLQLSYENTFYKFCNLDRATKTLQDPINNLDCGVRILAHWVDRDGAISTPDNKGAARYWSTLRESRHLPDLIARVKTARGC